MILMRALVSKIWDLRCTCKQQGAVRKPALTGINLLLEVRKIRRLRKGLQSRSNADAVRRVIDERSAVETGLRALRRLAKARRSAGRLRTRPSEEEMISMSVGRFSEDLRSGSVIVAK